MSDIFAGIVGAWSVSHAAIGLYFLLAFALGRREREFMLFGLLCFAFSVASVGIALDFISSSRTQAAAGEMCESTRVTSLSLTMITEFAPTVSAPVPTA